MQIADDKNEWNCRFGNERRNKRREKAKTYRHTDKQINWEILRIQYEKKSKKWVKVNIRNKFGRNSKGLRISS